MLKLLKSSILSNFPTISHGTIYEYDIVTEDKKPVNFSYKISQNHHIIDKNYQKLANLLNISRENIKSVNQTHSNNITIIDKPQISSKKIDSDGIITNLPNICLTITTADCLPILIYDADKNYIANIHAGWVGAFSGIIENTLLRFKELGSNYNDLNIAIMPAISQESYEVAIDFYNNFCNKSAENKQFFQVKNDKKYLFDLKLYAKSIFDKFNIKNIEILKYDSYNTDFLYSHRSFTHNKSEAGRNLTFIILKND